MIRLLVYIILLTPFYIFGQNIEQDSLRNDSVNKYNLEQFNNIVYDDNVIIKEIENCLNKKIYFLGTHHIGTPIYYEKIKGLLDSLKKEGFVLYYEGTYSTMYHDTTLGYLEKRVYSQKYKAILGRADADLSKKYSKVASMFEGLIVQPSPKELGALENDIHADVTIRMVVDYYESKYGRVHSNTDIEPERRKRRDDITQNFRNEFVIQEIQNNSHKKIVILYGSNHYQGLVEKMDKQCQ